MSVYKGEYDNANDWPTAPVTPHPPERPSAEQMERLRKLASGEGARNELAIKSALTYIEAQLPSSDHNPPSGEVTSGENAAKSSEDVDGPLEPVPEPIRGEGGELQINPNTSKGLDEGVRELRIESWDFLASEASQVAFTEPMREWLLKVLPPGLELYPIPTTSAPGEDLPTFGIGPVREEPGDYDDPRTEERRWG